jgi:hypothetical protein
MEIMLKKIKRKLLSVGSSYDDEGAFDENEKINEEDKAEAKKIMKTGKMAPTRRRCSKIKMRVKKMGVLLNKENQNSKKRMEIMLKKIKNKICAIICKVFKIKPCVCGHECGCKKDNK